MERALTKKRILEIYLNVAEWGDRGIFGIEAAARSYYGKSASALGPEEAARLAAILPNPRKFNPLGTSRYVVNRSNLIYNIMVRRVLWSQSMKRLSSHHRAAAKTTRVVLLRRSKRQSLQQTEPLSCMRTGLTAFREVYSSV